MTADALLIDQLRALVEKLRWVRKFVEYARYELEPGEMQHGDQFPRQSAADKAMAEIDTVIAALLNQQETCPDCNGTGTRLYAREVSDGCDRCNATGKLGPQAPQQEEKRMGRNDWLLDDNGVLDDVVVDDVAYFRLERMDVDHMWGAVYHRDGSRTTFDIFGDCMELKYEHEPAPAEAPEEPQT